MSVLQVKQDMRSSLANQSHPARGHRITVLCTLYLELHKTITKQNNMSVKKREEFKLYDDAVQTNLYVCTCEVIFDTDGSIGFQFISVNL